MLVTPKKAFVTLPQQPNDPNQPVHLTIPDVQELLHTTPQYAAWQVAELHPQGALLKQSNDNGQQFLNLPVSAIQKLYADIQPDTIQINPKG